MHLLPIFVLLFFSPFFAKADEGILAVQKKHAADYQRKLAEVKKAMSACTAVTQKGDWRNRKMSHNVQLELGGSCTIKNPSTSSIEALNAQIKKASKHMNEDKLWKDVNHLALNKTAKAIWATYMKLIKNEKLNQKSGIGMVCKYAPDLCRNQASLKVIQGAWAEFQAQTAKKPIKFLSGPEQDRLLHHELKPLIERANRTCQLTKKKNREIESNYSCVGVVDLKNFKPVKMMSKGECDNKLEARYRKQKELESIARKSMDLDMQLIVGSELGSLLITEKLREKMNIFKEDYVYKSCMKGAGSALNTVWNGDLFTARNDFFALTVKELRKIQDDANDSFDFTKRKTLKQYLKTNPATVAELLRKNPDPQNALALCSLIKSIHGWDQAGVIFDGVVVGTGLVASVALGFTGVGAPAGAALAGVVLGSTAITVTKSSLEYVAQVKQDARIRSSVATQQKKLDQGLQDLKVSDERKTFLLKSVTTDVALTATGYGLGKGLKLLNSLRLARNAAKVTAATAAEAEQIKKLEQANRTLQIHVKQLGPKGTHLSKMPLSQEAKVSEILTKLDPAQSKAFVNKLSQLKRPGEMDSFLKNLDEAQSLLAKKKYDPKLLAKLVDQSKKYPPVGIKLERDPQTAKLFGKLSESEQALLIKTAKEMKKTHKLKDAQVLEKLGELQKNCLSKIGLKKGCFSLEIVKVKTPTPKPTLVVEAPKSSMAKRFGDYVKRIPGSVKNYAKNYVADVKRTKGKRLFVKPRNQNQSRNPFKNPLGYLNNPIATIRNSSWQVTTPVSILGYSLLVDLPLEHVTQKAHAKNMNNVQSSKANLIGGEYVWEMMESGVISSEEVPKIFDAHDEDFDQWLNSKLTYLPRLDELAKVLKISDTNKVAINKMARDLYLKELNALLATGTEVTDEMKVSFHEGIRQKFAEQLGAMTSLNISDPQMIELLSTAYYPVVKIEKLSDVELTYDLLKNASGSTREIMARMEEGMYLSHGLYMVKQLRSKPEVINEKITQAKTELPVSMQKVAARPDLPSVLPTEMISQPGQAPVELKDELSRWKLIAKDPRFMDVKALYEKGEMNQFQCMEYVEKAIPAYNELYKIIEQKDLSPQIIDQALENPFFSSVKADLDNRADSSNSDRVNEKKKRAVTLWLKYQEELAKNLRPDMAKYQKSYEQIFQD